MTLALKLLRPSLLLLGLILSQIAYGQQTTQTDSTSAAPAPSGLVAPVQKSDPAITDLLAAEKLLAANQYDAAMAKITASIQANPNIEDAYMLRGNIYAQQQHLDLATKDFQKVLELNPKSTAAKFDIAELLFRQKMYDQARPGFAEMQSDPDNGDLASYKVFLCDLFAGHDAVAAKELDAFNQVGGNASYYFANAAWDLYHKKIDDARGWLESATHIYAPAKFVLYISSLRELGYLPLPPPPSQ